MRRTVLVALAAAGLTAPLVGVPALAAPDPITPVQWQRTVLTTAVQDPTDLDVRQDGAVVIAERTGAIKVWKQDGSMRTAGVVPVSANVSLTTVNPGELEEGGIHGMLLARDFEKSRRLYIRYSVPNSVNEKTGLGIFRVSSFVLDRSEKLQLKSEKRIIDVPTEWAHCCHYGSDMEWMADGTILMSVGDDTSPRDEGWNPRDKRKGREAFNAERTSQNPKSRSGKVLRFNADGSVPKNNPFVGNKAYDPYVFAMGFRSNYRIGHDAKTGTTFVGNVGADATSADPNRGPAGMDEVEQIPRKGGTNHGWPRCVGPNIAYQDYDYATGTSKGLLSCKGFTPAAIYYEATPSTTFPLVASGARTSMAGPTYRYSGVGALKLPAVFQGKLIHWDWSRSLMFATKVNDNGTLDTSTLTPWAAALPNTLIGAGVPVPVGGPTAPIETVVGPDGALYIAEYGSGYYQNSNSAISRITCFQCTPNARDYVGASAVAPDPDAGTTITPYVPGSPRPATAGVTTTVKQTLAATGSPTGLVAGGVAVLVGLAVLRRRVRALAVS